MTRHTGPDRPQTWPTALGLSILAALLGAALLTPGCGGRTAVEAPPNDTDAKAVRRPRSLPEQTWHVAALRRSDGCIVAITTLESPPGDDASTVASRDTTAWVIRALDLKGHVLGDLWWGFRSGQTWVSGVSPGLDRILLQVTHSSLWRSVMLAPDGTVTQGPLGARGEGPAPGDAFAAPILAVFQNGVLRLARPEEAGTREAPVQLSYVRLDGPEHPQPVGLIGQLPGPGGITKAFAWPEGDDAGLVALLVGGRDLVLTRFAHRTLIIVGEPCHLPSGGAEGGRPSDTLEPGSRPGTIVHTDWRVETNGADREDCVFLVDVVEIDLLQDHPRPRVVGSLKLKDFDMKVGARCTAGPEGDLRVAAPEFLDETHGPSSALVKRLDPQTGVFTDTTLRLPAQPTWWWVEPS